MDEFENIKIWPDKMALVEFATRRIVNMIHASLQVNDVFHIALAGGSTPRPIYEKLATEYGNQLAWGQIHLWFGDERCVAPDHEQSNYRMVNEALISKVAIPASNIHRMRGEDDPASAAQAYADDIKRAFVGHDEWFDLTLLGMGEDGHTASIFPGTASVNEHDRYVIAHHVTAKGDLWRLTLTFPALLKSANIMFLISGAGKAQALREVLYGDLKPDVYPSQIIARSNHQHITYAIDQAAAAHLND